MSRNSPISDATPFRYIVGIDLGTTNCAVSYVDTDAGNRTVKDFRIRQYVAPQTLEERDTLPSFLYALTECETDELDRVVDPAYRAGFHARDHGALTPGRLVASAKSWLCHGGVDRKSSILPWHAVQDVKTISPVQAQSIFLRHIRHAWDEAHPGHLLADQDVCITIPASFDEVARELTVEAARLAGLSTIQLIEEPQAAFYAWLSRHENNWQDVIKPDDQILVCDVGGGTTDLTLIHARADARDDVIFHRTAVGDHLILGGDNLDLALARHIEIRMTGGGDRKLNARDWSMLVRLCRHHKETLLSENAPESLEVILPGSGSGILRNQLKATISKPEVEQWLLDGFMPVAEWTSRPAGRSSGFQEFGLPFAPDPAITKYIAEFLRHHLPSGNDGHLTPPAAILLNGGLFESAAMRHRLKQVMHTWFDPMCDGGKWDPLWLEHSRLDLAVARGAAYFGLARRGQGIRVTSNLARAYYLGIETGENATDAICIAPSGMPAGSQITLDKQPFKLRLKSPVEFPMYVSSIRTTDEAGSMVKVDSESFTAMPTLRTVMSASRQSVQESVDVQLAVQVTEIGTLDLGIVEKYGSRTWKLAFDLRAATRTDMTFHDGAAEQTGILDDEPLRLSEAALRTYFAKSASMLQQHAVITQLETITGIKRDDWPVSFLRAMWQVMMEISEFRKLSAAHEQRWLNLTGYFLRPGFGYAIDDWRITETWRILPTGIHHPANEAVRAEWWILWRRIAGGLNQGQQSALGLPLVAAFRQLMKGKSKVQFSGGWDIRFGTHEMVELIRMLSMLERIDNSHKEILGDWFLHRIKSGKHNTEIAACIWGLAHAGARSLVYGPMQSVLHPEKVSEWLTSLCDLGRTTREMNFTLMMLSRRTGDRYCDIDEEVRNQVIDALKESEAEPHFIKLVSEGGMLDRDELNQSLGDSLPRGLALGRIRDSLI
ncbi:MAG TPA: Hsp70 family protein [Kiritimatiellia bacterium]|nr:Hsp70 family protein [Kiritimatiellia bacterium]